MSAPASSPTFSPKTIVHLLVGSAIGGAERLVVDLATAGAVERDANASASFRHVVAVQTPNDALVAFLRAAGVVVEARAVPRIGGLTFLANTFDPRERAWLSAVIARHDACMVHAHTFQSHLLGSLAARKSGVRHVRTEHHINHWEAATSAPFSRAALKNTDAIACISSYVHDFVRDHVPLGQTRLVTIPNGVDCERFTLLPASENAAPTFAMACRLEAWKRVSYAIRAVENVADAHLIIAGTGPEEAALKALAARGPARDRIRFVGHVQDTRVVLAEAHAVLSTSEREPFGLAVAEAMACGRPALALGGGGIDEVIGGEDGGGMVRGSDAVGTRRCFQTGTGSEEHQVRELTGMIEQFVADREHWPARSLRARTRVAARFSRTRMLADYTRFWESVLEPLSAGSTVPLASLGRMEP